MVALVAYAGLRPLLRPARIRITEPLPELLVSPDSDPRTYQLALARNRQAAAVNKALSHMKGGEPARAVAELAQALDENAECRSPLLDGLLCKDDLRNLYQLHLKNTDMPPNFATLLQLRRMLGIPQQEADAMEREVMEASGCFSI